MVRGAYVAPRTPAEEALAAIWADVLKLDRVGVHDNFFRAWRPLCCWQRVGIVRGIRDAFQIELAAARTV